MAKKTKISSDKSTPSQINELRWSNIKVISHTYEDWEIELCLNYDEVTDEVLPNKLKYVKDLISKKYNLPIYALQYQSLSRKEITDKGIIIHLRIKRITLDKGKPKFSFQSGISPSGIPYNDMACYADLYLLDEFDRELTESRIYSLLASEYVVKELIDEEAVQQAIRELKSKTKPLLGIRVAQGIFPDSGEDAEVEFYFHAQPSSENVYEYISSRKVKQGDILCSKSPPTEGKKTGLTARGRIIQPRKGLDINLQSGKNVRINIEETSLYAEEEGLVIVRREERSFMTPAGEKVIPSKIIARVDPLKVIEAGEEAVEITTKESLEIKGNLKMGSRIISSGEIHVNGNIEENSNIHAADDIIINGSVKNGNLSSDKNVITRYDVKGGKILAGRNVVISGTADNATVVGKQVHIDRIKGGRIVAGKSLTALEIGADEKGISATICVATRDFLKSKIEENERFLKTAKINMEKLTALFSEQIVNEVIPHNVQQMLLKFLSTLRKEGGRHIPQHNVATYKKLLNSIEPLRRLIQEKELENFRLTRQIRRSSKEKKLVIVKERITAKTKINIDDKIHIIEPRTGEFKISV